MAYSLKENLMKEERLSGGHRMCAGCGSPIAVRTVLRALEPEDKAVVCSATSCLEVSTFMYPYKIYAKFFWLIIKDWKCTALPVLKCQHLCQIPLVTFTHLFCQLPYLFRSIYDYLTQDYPPNLVARDVIVRILPSVGMNSVLSDEFIRGRIILLYTCKNPNFLDPSKVFAS